MNSDKNFEKQISRKTVNSILKDILQHRQIKFNEIKTENSKLTNEDIEILLKKEHFYFRGESSFHKLRTPSLYLQKNLTVSGSEYYYRILLNELGRDDYQESTSLVRLISELQHYGAKTRMLDITKNPLIALYFAVEKDDEEPGFVFIYKSDELDEKFDTGHTVAVKSALNFISQKIINNFLDSIEYLITLSATSVSNLEYIELDNLIQELIKLGVDKDELEGDCISDIARFMELLNQRARVRERLIYPFKIFMDLQKSHVVIPSKTTDRIRQQQGAFIYPRFVSSSKMEYDDIIYEISKSIDTLSATLVTSKNSKEDPKMNSTEKLSFSVIKIDGGNKKAIRNQLELLGITEGFVYPDIEHQSKALLKQLDPKSKE